MLDLNLFPDFIPSNFRKNAVDIIRYCYRQPLRYKDEGRDTIIIT